MKKIITILTLGLIFAAFQPSYAILAPFNQSVIEIRAILSSNELSALKTGYPIINIHRNDTGYILETEQETMQVELIIKPTKRVGPVQFDLKFHPPVSK